MKALQKYLLKNGLDCALFLNGEKPDPNSFYLTGYNGSGVLIVPSRGKAILHVPDRDKTEALNAKNANVSVADKNRKLSDVLKEKGISTKKIGICFENTFVSDFNSLKEKFNCSFTDLSGFMKELRMQKRTDEIAKIKKACTITDKIIEKFVANFKKFKTESDATAFLTYEARSRGCGLAFEPIVASGANAAVPHHVPSGAIKSGFCVVDFGVTYKGYCSDVTRTFYVGKPTEKERRLYAELLKIQEDSILKVIVGGKIAHLYNDAKRILGDKFIHSLGHGMGIEVHEAPNISYTNEGVFKKNMVVTIEPGVYVSGKYGIRIEDDVLVTSGKPRVLSKFSKELITL